MHDVATNQQTQTYNGWRNRETWLVNIWLTNDEGSAALLDDVSKRDGDLYDKADWLERMIRESYELQYQQGNLWSDLMSVALSQVDWFEIACWADCY